MPQRKAKNIHSKSSAYAYSGARLREHWDALHKCDREPYPDARQIGRLAESHAPLAIWIDAHGGGAAVADALQHAWREFHGGDFAQAIKLGSKLGALGAQAANKAAAVCALFSRLGKSRDLVILSAGIERAEDALGVLPDYPNAHYNYALVLGRYSQQTSILKALANGLAGRIRENLERTLKLEPRHAEAHVALGLYHAEIIGKLGAFAARLAYQVSSDGAIEHFQRALKLVPASPVTLVEYGRCLLLLDARANRADAERLYAKASACTPADAMEGLYVEHAQHGPG